MQQTIEGYRLGPHQKHLWLLERQGGSAFVLQCTLRLRGDLDRRALREAARRLVERHEILRTSFELLPGMQLPIQVILEHSGPVWREVDLGGEPAELGNLEKLEASVPFHRGETPHVRLTLASIDPADHALVVTQPALCSDPRSLVNLAYELSKLYEIELHGLEPLPEPLQYVQFSEWHNDLAVEEASAEGREFWRKRLDTPNEMALPFESRSDGSPDLSVAWSLPTDLVKGALRLTGEQGLPDLLLGCWALLLSRIAGNEEVTMWCLFDGRKYDELRDALGLFARYLPLCLRFSEGMSAVRLIKRMGEVTREGAEWQEYFGLDGDRLPETFLPPLGFDFQSFPEPWESGGLCFSLERMDGRLEHLRLQLSCSRSSEALRVKIRAEDAGLDSAAIAGLAHRFERLLRSMVEGPSGQVFELEILSAEERRQLLSEWNGASLEYPRNAVLPRLFEEQVERTPDAPAVCAGEEVLSFTEVNLRANRLAHHLRRLGAVPESRVALCVGRSVRQIIAVWGILKSGAAYVPLDPMQPRQRLLSMLEDAGVGLVVADREFRELFNGFPGISTVLVDDTALERESGENPQIPLYPFHLAYVIYTSGSTGRPKGVMVRQDGVVNLLLALEERVYAGAELGLRVSLNAPLSFDASVKQIVQCLRGRTLVAVPEEVRANGEELLAFLARQRVEVLDCTPSQLLLLFEAGLGRERGCLRRVLVGGEAVSPLLWDRLAALPDTKCYNVYGPTECTVDTTACEVAAHTHPVLGRPLANVRSYVLDHRLQLVPAGMSGELCVGGKGLARGYIGRPDLTAEKFVPDPFGGNPGGCLYRTGDLARWRRDGLLEFLGRIDHQVKVRGFRIELGEIEAILRQHPGVAEAVAVLRGDLGSEHSYLAAYAVPRRRWAARVEGRSRRALPNGLAVVEQNRDETEYLYEEIFANRSYLQHGLTLPPGACVFDVGANIGMFTLFVRQECPTARIYAFEPIAQIFETLRINTELYADEVKLLQFGLSNRERTETFAYYPRYSMMSSQSDYSRPTEDIEITKRLLRNEGAQGKGGAGAFDEADEILAGHFRSELQPGRLRRLSDVLREERVERINLLKIDVQRAEMDVLGGISEEDWGRIDQVVLEAHDAKEGESAGRISQLIELFERHGFRVVVEQNELLAGTDRHAVYAVREGASPVPSVRAKLDVVPVLTVEDLREHLRQNLPNSMLPAAMVLLDELPLTRNGKIDRSALPGPEEEAAQTDEQPAGTRTPFEEILLEIWTEVLKTPRIGVEASFFELGGHSLLATQLISRVREVFPVELPLRSLFEGPTVRELAQRIEQAMRAESGLETVPMVRVPRDRPLPLSFAQERLWFLEELTPGSARYNSPRAVRLHGDLEVSALAAALAEVTRRHEALRTSFPVENGMPVQRIASPGPFALPVADLRVLPCREGEAEATRLAESEARRPFDFVRGPLLRASLIWIHDREHWLLVTLHHIVTDGWSMGLLIREISSLYVAFAAGQSSPLPDLPIQYGDFAYWQRSWLSGEVLERELAYWRERLGGSTGVLNLPSDRPRPAVRTDRGARRDLMLPERLSLALRALSRRERATLFMTLLAGFQALLGRYTNQSDFNLGTPIAGRNRVEVEGLIGLFVNILILRSDLGGDPAFLELIERARKTSLEAYAHQDLQFEKLVDELAPERSLSHSPLFQVAFGLHPTQPAAEVSSEVEIEAVETNTGTAKFDLTLTIADDGLGGIAGSLEFSTDLFDPSTVERLLAHYRILLESAVARPALPISKLGLLSEAERHHLVTEVAGEGSLVHAETLLHDLFAEQARRNPERVAVACADELVTYGELDLRATALARRLVWLGVGPEARVGLCTERGTAMILGVLGILRAGGAYVPLDPSYPQERLRYLLEDSGVEVLLTHHGVRDRLPEHRAFVLELDGVLEASEETTPLPRIDPDNLAYVIYTSGSTGRPKGVGVTHANVVQLLRSTEEKFHFGPEDAWTLFHSHAFDFSVWEMWGALAYGGRLVVVPYLVSRSPADFHNLLRRERITVLNQTPSAFRHLIEEDVSAGTGSDLSLRWVIFGGEALDLRGLRPWLEKHGDRRPCLVNMYGITETTVHVTYRSIALSDLSPGGASLIGGPLSNLRLYLLDRGGELAPLGVPGEIHVGGDGLARGYLGRPDLTSERFMPDPFSKRPGDRLYRSGDLARHMAEGDLEYVGRIDHQIKIRGFRIELGEIEAALAEHPAVRRALVMVRDGEGGEKRLIAYLVVGIEPFPGHGELREFLQQRLPEHMIPAAFVPLSELPLTAHGKIDRAALPEPGRERFGPEVELTLPSTLKEHILAEVWSQVLGLERVGMNDNFFALGGDSILSIRVRAMAARRGVSFELQDLFRRPTLRELAETAVEASGDEPPDLGPFALVAPEDRERLPLSAEDAYPLSRLQAGMLFHGDPSHGRTLYHNVSCVVLRGPVDVSAFRAAVAKLAELHPVLRTSFDAAQFSEPLQIVHRAVEIPVEVSDLRGLSPKEQERLMAEHFEREQTRLFDWGRPPLLRFWIHQLEEERAGFGWTEHHTILDGWSVAAMLAELFALYFARLAGEPTDDRPPVAAFRDFVALERRTLSSEESRRYWAETLAGTSLHKLPRWPRPGVTDRQSRTAPVEVSPETARALSRFAGEVGVPFKSVLLACHVRLLALLGGVPDVLTGIVSNGRPERTDGERVLGLFLNTLPLRLRVENGTWKDLARTVLEAELAMLPHRRYPLADLQREHGGGQPFFEAVFNYVQFHVLRGLSRFEVLSSRASAETNYTLFFNCSRDPQGEHLRVDLVYDPAELRQDQALAFAEHASRILGAMACDSEGNTASLPLPEEQRHQLLVEWNDTSSLLHRDLCLHHLLEAQAELRPDAAALVQEDTILTYARLNTEADRLAFYLRALGVGLEERVAVCLPHSPELVTAILAVLKAGGAYVPLAPTSPAERLSWMIADSGARLLIAERELAETLPPHGARAFYIREPLPALIDTREQIPLGAIGPRNAAYVIYTSGSTSTPKGVVVPHGAVTNHTLSAMADFDIVAQDRWLQFCSLSFDASAEEIYTCLAAGATLVLREESMLGSIAYFLSILDRLGITVLDLPTSFWHELVSGLSQDDLSFPASLRLVVIGGEKAHGERWRQWRRSGCNVRLINGYGPTEATISVTRCDLTSLPDGVVDEPPLGRSIHNTTAYVLDRSLMPTLPGVPGELCVGGGNLARGYLARLDLTAASFVPDPYGDPGGRLYRTGDLMRRLPDGSLEYLGRIDHQVKIRGFRVEPGEIEAALMACPGIKGAAAVLRQEGAGFGSLVAYVVTERTGAPDGTELRRLLSATLPPYMVPSGFVFLDTFPMTAGGKIDRRALPAVRELRVEREARRHPRTPIEETLAAIWEKVLGRKDVSADESFLDLGGHSLAALQVASRVRSVFGIDIPIQSLFAALTLADHALIVEESLRSGRLSEAPPLVSVPREGDLPLSFAQERLWFLEQLEPGGVAY
ncbi:MAG TPA: amino acid adenylation domain-containing protein, partial [Thermoanaerobaculia bacterium]